MGQPCCCCSGNGCCSGGSEGIPVAATALSRADIVGVWKVRWGIGRMDYKVNPGLYAVGKPDGGSPVLVSANYKLTFDTLRKNLDGLDCYLLILDTKGVNVWCAAGKGTFGTEELVRRIEVTGLSEVVTHKALILPQLGASGVSAHEVARRTGFYVAYGPVRAADIKAYIAAGHKATPEMRTVKFPFKDRVALTPVQLVEAVKPSLIALGVLFLFNLFIAMPFGGCDLLAYVGALLMGCVLAPMLLPWIPGKAFSLKGWLLGLCWTALILWLYGWFSPATGLLALGYLLLFPPVSAYLAMNFTGCSTFTSPSGVLKEMKIALPLIVGSASVGSVLILIAHLVG